ncbi:type VI secretion system tube protein TssD [Bacteroides thetaiotaomicron]|uniref:type VI secretion system tube protein TssD n=1 Tax=Bacteroides thetaiotaomicron TaxID=818 RepID=UPI001F2DD023|nr:type VI secretion system tube protein TssD [Bacteroides thetaiotaomicron]MCE8488529.1 hypothetical protein [Bacteroides thetaiotaomicron]
MGLFNFPQVDSNVNVTFCVDGDEYEVAQFKIGFHQPVDGNKNQPEGEVRGGRIMITLSQTVKNNIYGWAIKPWVKKNGAVLFKTGTSGVIFEVAFTNAYCISLKRSISIATGLNTNIILSSESAILNGIDFNNQWVK